MPAFAGSLNAGDKPMVVAEGVEIGVGGVALGSVIGTGIMTTPSSEATAITIPMTAAADRRMS